LPLLGSNQDSPDPEAEDSLVHLTMIRRVSEGI